MQIPLKIEALFEPVIVKERRKPMIQLMVTEEERKLLIQLLENDISDLRMEIANTHRQEYRNMLKNRELLMKNIQQKLEQVGEKVVI
jgi:hypothetical protein